jgi:hypothetical protein
MSRIFILSSLLCLSASLRAQPTAFEHVKLLHHPKADKRMLVDTYGTLTFDESARKLRFKPESGTSFEVGYDDVEKAVFEVTTHMRAGVVSRGVSWLEFPAGLVVGNVLGSAHVNSYWIYLSCRKDGGEDTSVLFETPGDSSGQILKETTTVFGSRLTVTSFPEKATEINLRELKAANSKQVVKVDKKNHPLPETKPDKATVVFVCPPLAGHRTGAGAMFKIHANDQVVAVNKVGTYSFAYLDPGRYRLASQQQNASGFEMNLEAGREYLFLQNTFQEGLTPEKTVLSRNSPDLVNYLLDGSYFSNWKPKGK